jgi:choline-phosphate cytidylyltransferase
VFQILGTAFKRKIITTKFLDKEANMDAFTKIDFVYPGAVASIKVAKAAKAEGELIIAGSKGYIYVPAPWWKMDYFEVRYENLSDNRRYFYQLDGEGIRYELVEFARLTRKNSPGLILHKETMEIALKIG